MPIAAPASSHAVLVVDDDREIRELLRQHELQLHRGPGTLKSAMARVMQPFGQLDRSRGGAWRCGARLSIANENAIRHGGPLLISNRARGGLCATL